MNEKNKSLLIILATLLIGGVIGALIWGSVSNRRNAEIRGLRAPEGMARFLLDRLEPIDGDQRERLHMIIDEHGTTIESMRQEMRQEMESFREELSEVLNDDQKSRLDRILRSGDKRRGRGGRGRLGPEGDGARPGPGRRGFRERKGIDRDSIRAERPRARRDSL